MTQSCHKSRGSVIFSAKSTGMRLLLGMYIVFMVVMFTRCRKETEVDELTKQCSKVQVVFTDGMQYTDITDRSEIRKFSSYISSEQAPIYQCGFDGRIVFFTSQGQVEMDFVLQDACRHIEYQYGGILQSKKITDEGVAYLQSLKKE